MKRLFVLSSLALSAVIFAPSVHAQEVNPYPTQPQGVDSQTTPVRQVTREVTPFNLTTLAYRGYFSEQGIPGYGNLIVALNTGRITADDIIQAAVDAGRTSSTTGDSSNYRSALQQQLFTLSNTRGEGD